VCSGLGIRNIASVIATLPSKAIAAWRRGDPGERVFCVITQL
jgi:hypothetical protein